MILTFGLVMTKLPAKFGESRPKHSPVIDRKPFGLWTNRPKAISKTIYPLFVEGGAGVGGALGGGGIVMFLYSITIERVVPLCFCYFLMFSCYVS